MTNLKRRGFIKLAGALLATKLPSIALGAAPHVIVVGGGAAGTIVARRIVNAGAGIRVTLIERHERYYSSLLGSQTLAGFKLEGVMDFGYENVGKQGIDVIHDSVAAIDPQNRLVSLGSGNSLSYDRLVLATGIRVDTHSIAGYDAKTALRMPHAWSDPEQNLLLRRQIESMRTGGTIAMTVPADPISSPAAPYERASHIAYFLKQQNPTAKVLICDAKNDFPLSELFRTAWDDLYPGMIEWVGGTDTGGEVTGVDPNSMKISFPQQSFVADVINIIPPQSAGFLAESAGVKNALGWCPVDISTFETIAQPGVYVIGDAAQAHSLPKTAQMANSQAKVCASAIVASFGGEAVGPVRFVTVDYSVVAPDYGIYSIATYKPDDSGESVVTVSTRQSSSDTSRSREFQYAMSWYNNISREMFG